MAIPFPPFLACLFLFFSHSLTFPSRFASFCEKYGIGISASRCTAIEAPALRSRGLAAKNPSTFTSQSPAAIGQGI